MLYLLQMDPDLVSDLTAAAAAVVYLSRARRLHPLGYAHGSYLSEPAALCNVSVIATDTAC